MSRLCLYYRQEPDCDRWVAGDRFVRGLVRRLVRGKPRLGGVDKVFLNLCLGLKKLGAPYEVNPPFSQLCSGDRVGVLGRARHCLEGYDHPYPIVAGIGLMTHPSEWPTLCEDYPIACYLQHSEWANNVYKPYFGERCTIWPVGVDTDKWKPPKARRERTDFLIYDKVRWEHDRYEGELLQPIRKELKKRRLSFREIRYGSYKEEAFLNILQDCKGMIFLCEHESQGLAYQECLSSDVPILAWDQGRCLDPNRFKWGQPDIPATSVPYFDEKCGMKFKNILQFPERLDDFLVKLKAGGFAPRDYILENLTLERCALDYLHIVRRYLG